ncbi:hypothetical protein HPB50_008356 [Hyalomma asiaticum]|uniref:Uncharacterized protein n=1 Tax=Hyalomma asiaticum TaxID=266040 RepID=A0ACB7SWV1_HYAAI|nr:hypothetical protein HPB50_008356 [Hyalomma asiaticum]
MTMVLLVLSNVVLIPVQASYFNSVDDEIFQWMFFSLVSDAVFAADIVFNFRTGVVVEEDYERVVMDPGYVARSYLRGFFLIDLVSTMPWDYLLALMLIVLDHQVDEGDASFAITVRLLHLTKFLKLLKLLRITRLVRYLDNVEQNYVSILTRTAKEDVCSRRSLADSIGGRKQTAMMAGTAAQQRVRRKALHSGDEKLQARVPVANQQQQPDVVGEPQFFYSNGVYLRLTNYIGLLLLIGHWNACLQFFVPRMQGFPPDSWVAKQDLVASGPVALNSTRCARALHLGKGKPWFEQYSWSIYNAISQMVSCGYGRSAAANVADAWLMCLGMASGTVGYALLLGLCASTIQTMDYSRRLLREKLKEVEDYMQCQKFPNKLRSRMRDYFENRYEGRVFDEAKILASLSDPLREEIVNHSIRTTVRTVPFFAQSEPTFVAELVSRLRREFFQPGDLIVKQDTVGHKMYFLQSGKVNIVHDNGEFVACAYPGAYFGEMCLLTRARRQANVVAETYCNVLSLSDEDFQQALEKHPLMRRALEALCAELGTPMNPVAMSSTHHTDPVH